MKQDLFSLFKKVESLKTKVVNNESLTLDEACLLIWADFDVGLNSKENLNFKNWVLQKYTNKASWPVWKNIFLQFEKINGEQNEN